MSAVIGVFAALPCSSVIEARLDSAAIKKILICDMNKYRIKQCCASCQHKMIDEDGTRICNTMQLKVEKKFRCRRWVMSDALAKSKLPRFMFL